MGGNKDYFKLITKKPLDEMTRTPTLDEVEDDHWVGLHSKNPLLPLALSLKQGQVSVTQEQREDHFWVLGSTGEGKSKFLEYMIRKDIDRLLDEQQRGIDPKEGRACSLCFIDPTPQGKIAKLVLNYCAQIGFKKVFYVDPLLIRDGKVPPINPFHYKEAHIETSVDYLMDAFRVLFEVEDPSRTSNITTYLNAIFSLVHYAGLTASDLLPFTTIKSTTHQLERERIIRMVQAQLANGEIPRYKREIIEKHIEDVTFAYTNYPIWKQEISSTVRRLNQLVNNSRLRLIFGHRKGVNFEKLVSEGWILLVNTSTGGGLGTLQARLLATVIINELIFTIEKLRDNGFDKPYYLYLDEASRYATDKLVEVLDLKRNIDLRLILSNQYPSQLKKRGIYDSVKTNAKTKVAFYLANPQEREDVVKMMYGGALPDREVSYALSSQEKREAVFKLNKREAVVAKTFDVPDAPFDKVFLESLLQTRNYATPDEIQKDYDERFNTISDETTPGEPRDTEPPRPRKVADRKATTNSNRKRKPNPLFDD
jgi:hypothetical protein